MKVAIYTRISPVNSKKEKNTVNQLLDLERFAEANKWEVVQRYEDLHISGKASNNRPGFKLMMEDARKRKYDMLLFWSLDRLSREGVAETLGYLNLLNSYGVNYKSYTEQYLDSIGIFKDVIIGIMATIAKQERVRLVERTIAGLERVKVEGTKSGKAVGRPRVILDKVKILELYTHGSSIREIAKKYETSYSTIRRVIK